MIALAEPVGSVAAAEVLLLKSKLVQQVCRDVERRIDALALPHSECRVLERRIKVRADQILATAAADCLQMIDEEIKGTE